jgi:hypothetical protein
MRFDRTDFRRQIRLDSSFQKWDAQMSKIGWNLGVRLGDEGRSGTLSPDYDDGSHGKVDMV